MHGCCNRSRFIDNAVSIARTTVGVGNDERNISWCKVGDGIGGKGIGPQIGITCGTASYVGNGSTVVGTGASSIGGTKRDRKCSRFTNRKGCRSSTSVGVGDGIGYVSSSDIGKGPRSGVRSSSASGSYINGSGLSVTKNGGSNGSRNVEQGKGTNALRGIGGTTVGIGNGHEVITCSNARNGSRGCPSWSPSIGITSGTTRNTHTNGSIRVTRSGSG